MFLNLLLYTESCLQLRNANYSGHATLQPELCLLLLVSENPHRILRISHVAQMPLGTVLHLLRLMMSFQSRWPKSCHLLRIVKRRLDAALSLYLVLFSRLDGGASS
jgi:hypothetical protein